MLDSNKSRLFSHDLTVDKRCFKMKESGKTIPEVFCMKPLNNMSKDDNIKADISIITNQMCHCKVPNDQTTMLIRFRRSKTLCILLAILLLIVCPCLIYLFVKSKHLTIPSVTSNLLLHQPPITDQRSIFHIRSLDNVFISVKTTKKYHYPRLIIQLETWVSLARAQVLLYRIWNRQTKSVSR